MGIISINLDFNASIALRASLEGDLGREPTNVELWNELIAILGKSGPPPEDQGVYARQVVLEYEVLIK